MKIYNLIPHDTKIDFVKHRFKTFIFSVFLTVFSVCAFILNGLNYGIDFRGGFVLEVKTQDPADIAGMRKAIEKLPVGEVSLQEFGSPHDVLIRIPANDETFAKQDDVLSMVKKVLGDNVEYRKVEKIGPKVGAELVHNAILAVVISLIAILSYIWIRFEWQFAVCGVIALAHDCIVLMGMYSVFGNIFEFNVNSIVALLMTAGYSIHDTVVVYDRIRENMNKYRNMKLSELLNFSMNETLSRTLLTSLTTLLALGALCIFGGKVIFEFSFPILVGIAFGTFSSICLSAPLLLYTGVRVDGKDLEIGL